MQGAEFNLTQNFSDLECPKAQVEVKGLFGSPSLICHYDRHQMGPLIFVGHQFCILLIKKICFQERHFLSTDD